MLPVVDYFLADEYSFKLVLSGLVGAYTAYYLLAARSPPVLYGYSKKLVNFYREHIPFLREVYSPFVFGFTGRVQTILRPLFHRAEKLNYEEEVITFPDGGEMQLSWNNLEGMADDTPVVVLLPGLTGCSCCDYVASLVKEINNCNYRCVVANNRGTCKHKLKTPFTYCAAHTSDIAAVFDHVRDRFPDAPMVAVGISLGALLVFNYLADRGESKEKEGETKSEARKPCPLTAAMCICMPWDVVKTSDKLEKPMDWLLFNYPLTQGLRQLVERNADVLAEKYDVQRILQSRSVREFDAQLTVQMFGYASVEEYYACASPAAKIERMRPACPILCLNAADDPFVPFSTLPLEKVNSCPESRVVLALTRHGGHIGFLNGLLPTRPNLLDRAVPQFASGIFHNLALFEQINAAEGDHADNEGATIAKDAATAQTLETKEEEERGAVENMAATEGR